MYRIVKALFVACLVCIPALGFAEPGDTSYDNAGWREFIENGKTEVLPKGVPAGKGAVSSYRGSGFWPEDYVSIVKPYDLSRVKGLQFSSKAKNDKRYYGSETAKLFLEATLQEARKISKNDAYVIPVKALFYDKTVFPIAQDRVELGAIEFGAFVMHGEEHAIDLDGVLYHDYVRSLGENANLSRYDRSQKRARSIKKDFSKTGALILEHIAKQIDREIDNEMAIESAIKTAQYHLKEGDIVMDYGKYKNEVAELRSQIGEKLPLVISESDPEKKLSMALELKELNDDYSFMLLGRLSLANENVDDDVRFKHKVEDFIYYYNKALTDVENDDSGDNSSVSDLTLEYNKQNDDALVDIPAMWTFVDAIMSQKAVEVTDIHMTVGLMERLADYAYEMDLPDEKLDRLEELVAFVDEGFGVCLGCSIRDRFLGCQSKFDKDGDKVISIASGLLSHVYNVPFARRYELIRLVVNAHPARISGSFDIAELQKELDNKFDLSEGELLEYQGLLNRLSMIEGVRDSVREKREADKAKSEEREKRDGSKGKRLTDSSITIPF